MSPDKNGGVRGIWFEGNSLDRVLVGVAVAEEFVTGAAECRHPHSMATESASTMMNVRASRVLLTSSKPFAQDR